MVGSKLFAAVLLVAVLSQGTSLQDQGEERLAIGDVDPIIFDVNVSEKKFDVVNTNMNEFMINVARNAIEKSFDYASNIGGRVSFMQKYFAQQLPGNKWTVIEKFGAIRFYAVRFIHIRKRYHMIWHDFLIYY